MDAGPISTRDLYSFSNISPNRGELRKGQASRNHQQPLMSSSLGRP